MKEKMFDFIQTLETDYGYFIMNPIGDNWFVFSPEKMKERDRIINDLMIFRNTYIEKEEKE